MLANAHHVPEQMILYFCIVKKKNMNEVAVIVEGTLDCFINKK